VQTLLVQISTAVARDALADTEVGRATDDLKKHTEAIEDPEIQAQRVKDAKDVLDDLLRRHKEDVFTAEILQQNADEISRIFASIHTPNEFDLRVDKSGLHIVRRQGDCHVDLNEMSSGQRAAYALSLFLAMNARLPTGPKVMLFDDPIAHADDINVLSFLDYLRELALTEMRQIFFATADAKLAGLFRHKFRFLGDRQFREISLRREVWCP
jgi:DNA repair exonuclease SbcCD ATPase subunit